MRTHPTTSELQAVLRPIGHARGLPAATYVSPEWARVERDTVLGRTWACIGHEADIGPREAVPATLLGMPLVMVRDPKGTLRVFHNVCRHRGYRLVDGPCKLEGALRCPYHSWTYGYDGSLRGTPHIGGPGVHQAEGFDRAAHGLFEVRSAVWMGLVFVNLTGDAPEFAAQIAPLVERWEGFTGLGGLDALRAAGPEERMTLELRANWKLAVENYCESYHLPWIHPGLNTYSRLEDHYHILADDWGAGQGSRAFRFDEHAGIHFPHFPGWPEDRKNVAEYIALYPNVLLGIHVDHFFSIVLVPVAHDRTVEVVEIRYVGDASLGADHVAARRTLVEGWRAVFLEDVGVVEGMQAGRDSPAFDGGAFSPVMDNPTHHFHAWVAARALPPRLAEATG